nr:hypothetical protein [uncultured bacterium]
MKMATRHRIAFMGTPEFAVPSLRALLSDAQFEVVAVVTQPDKPVGRKQTITPSPVKAVAQEQGITVLQPSKVKTNADFWAELRELNPDVIVVVAYGKILPQEILDIPPKGIVNVHASLLPKYRGASPISASILNGDSETGVTIMKMDLEMDTGSIIAKSQPVSISPTDTTQSLTTKLAEVGAKTLIENLSKYLDGEITPTPQNEAEATYVKMLQKEDGLINWQNDEDLISRQVRAYTPWPSAHTRLPLDSARGDNCIVKIISAEVAPDIDNPKGKIQKIGQEMFIGKLKVSQLQPAGGKPMSGSAFLAGHADLIGISVL